MDKYWRKCLVLPAHFSLQMSAFCEETEIQFGPKQFYFSKTVKPTGGHHTHPFLKEKISFIVVKIYNVNFT